MKLLLKVNKAKSNKSRIVLKEVDINRIKSIEKLKSIFQYHYNT